MSDLSGDDEAAKKWSKKKRFGNKVLKIFGEHAAKKIILLCIPGLGWVILAGDLILGWLIKKWGKLICQWKDKSNKDSIKLVLGPKAKINTRLGWKKVKKIRKLNDIDPYIVNDLKRYWVDEEMAPVIRERAREQGETPQDTGCFGRKTTEQKQAKLKKETKSEHNSESEPVTDTESDLDEMKKEIENPAPGKQKKKVHHDGPHTAVVTKIERDTKSDKVTVTVKWESALFSFELGMFGTMIQLDRGIFARHYNESSFEFERPHRSKQDSSKGSGPQGGGGTGAKKPAETTETSSTV